MTATQFEIAEARQGLARTPAVLSTPSWAGSIGP
jgi:hypothetical protein